MNHEFFQCPNCNDKKENQVLVIPEEHRKTMYLFQSERPMKMKEKD